MKHKPMLLSEAVKINKSLSKQEIETAVSATPFDNPEEFGRQVIAELRNRGATQSDLAVALGVSRQRISAVLVYSGLGTPIARRIASALDMDLCLSLRPRKKKS